MERKVRAEKAVSIGDITIVPVVEVRLNYRRVSSGLFFSAVKQPWAVLLIAGGEKRAFSPEGKEMSFTEVLAKVSETGYRLLLNEDS